MHFFRIIFTLDVFLNINCVQVYNSGKFDCVISQELFPKEVSENV